MPWAYQFSVCPVSDQIKRTAASAANLLSWNAVKPVMLDSCDMFMGALPDMCTRAQEHVATKARGTAGCGGMGDGVAPICMSHFVVVALSM